MEQAYYSEMARVENEHWWFVARRKIISHLLGHYYPEKYIGRILEIGCGTGGNLKMLSAWGSLVAVEPHSAARDIATAKQLCSVYDGKLPGGLPKFGEKCDLVVACDVIEHVQDDSASLLAMRGLLKEGGRVLVTVPACPFLWSEHDEVNHHFRRYSRASLIKVAKSAGFEIEYCSYFNSFLFGLVAGQRVISRFFPIKKGLLSVPPRIVNMLLENIMASERYFMPYMRFPIGVSLIAIMKQGS